MESSLIVFQNPEPLQRLAFKVEITPGNNLLHQFVLDNTDDGVQYSEEFIHVVLTVMYVSQVPVNAFNHEGYTALHLAVMKNNASMVKNLLAYLKNRINVNIEGRYYQTPLQIAIKAGHDMIVKELLKDPGILVNKKEWISLRAFLTSEQNSHDIGSGYNGHTPLHQAVKYGHCKVVKELLKAPGILVNETANYEGTPLHMAAKYGHYEMVKELLKAPGILVNATDHCSSTPLHVVAQNGHCEVVKELLKADGILINETDGNGRTPLHVAVESKHYEVVKELLKAPGILINTNSYDGRTPLHIAVRYGYYKVVQELLKAPGILVNETRYDGNTPLHVAVQHGHYKVVKELLKAPGILVNEIRNDGRTPLDVAVKYAQRKIVKKLTRSSGYSNKK